MDHVDFKPVSVYLFVAVRSYSLAFWIHVQAYKSVHGAASVRQGFPILFLPVTQLNLSCAKVKHRLLLLNPLQYYSRKVKSLSLLVWYKSATGFYVVLWSPSFTHLLATVGHSIRLSVFSLSLNFILKNISYPSRFSLNYSNFYSTIFCTHELLYPIIHYFILFHIIVIFYFYYSIITWSI